MMDVDLVFNPCNSSELCVILIQKPIAKTNSVQFFKELHLYTIVSFFNNVQNISIF